MELRLATELAQESDLVVLDGMLSPSFTGEEEALRALMGKGTPVCGLSKTTRLFTETGNSAAVVLGSKAPAGCWLYHIGEESYLTQLHPASQHVFRLDLTAQPVRVGVSLVEQANDPVFPGYPYGLIDADKLARISNQEAEYLKTSFIAKAGKDLKQLKKYMHTVNAHAVLDSIC